MFSMAASGSRSRPQGCCPFEPLDPLPKTERDRRVAVFKALADPTRLELLRSLAGQAGPTCVCDLVDHFDLSQPTISHHLKVLREAGLIEGSRAGIWSFHRVAPGAVELLGAAPDLLRPR